MKILVINSGSSSIKYKLFDMPQEACLSRGIIEHIGERASRVPDHYSGLKIILNKIKDVDVVGHRVVHGAEEFKRPVLIDKNVINKIRQCVTLAPLHNPANLSGILACSRLLSGVRQVAVFDTAFHQTLPDYAYIYGLPYGYYQKLGIRKYGFHGTSHQYVSSEAAKHLRRPLRELNVITCHLGNGCSIAAIKKGVCVDTSMGFTPLEGLIMGTRCGDIDPALVTYLMRSQKLSAREIDAVLNKASGLQGISGISNDMRVLEKKARQADYRARLALEIFAYRIKKYIGAYVSIMGGCDVLVFTGGIGENQRKIREMVCRGFFSFLKKKPAVIVIPTDEELMIARQAYSLSLQKR